MIGWAGEKEGGKGGIKIHKISNGWEQKANAHDYKLCLTFFVVSTQMLTLSHWPNT